MLLLALLESQNALNLKGGFWETQAIAKSAFKSWEKNTFEFKFVFLIPKGKQIFRLFE